MADPLTWQKMNLEMVENNTVKKNKKIMKIFSDFRRRRQFRL